MWCKLRKRKEGYCLAPIKIFDICIKYINELIGSKSIINDEVVKTIHEFYNTIGCAKAICKELGDNCLEEDVKKVLMCLPNGTKSMLG